MPDKNRMLTTQRLVLRPFEEADREAAIRILCDPEIQKTYMVPDLSDPGKADQLFERFMALSRAEGRMVWAVTLDERCIGFLNDVGVDGPVIELGYVIHPDHQGKGYATEALIAAIREAFRRGFTIVRAGHFAENGASRRVMEKCGMQPIALTEEITYRGAVHRCLYMEIHAPA